MRRLSNVRLSMNVQTEEIDVLLNSISIKDVEIFKNNKKFSRTGITLNHHTDNLSYELELNIDIKLLNSSLLFNASDFKLVSIDDFLKNILKKEIYFIDKTLKNNLVLSEKNSINLLESNVLLEDSKYDIVTLDNVNKTLDVNARINKKLVVNTNHFYPLKEIERIVKLITLNLIKER